MVCVLPISCLLCVRPWIPLGPLDVLVVVDFVVVVVVLLVVVVVDVGSRGVLLWYVSDCWRDELCAIVVLVIVVVVDWETGHGTDMHVRQLGAQAFGLNVLKIDPLLRSQASPELSSVLVPQLITTSIYNEYLMCVCVYM